MSIYGMTIFILTFCLVVSSSYRVDDVIQLALLQGVSTITIGAPLQQLAFATHCFCFMLEDLHKLLASRMDKLPSFLEGKLKILRDYIIYDMSVFVESVCAINVSMFLKNS
jgi:Aluminium activated malate transporter